MNNNLFVWFIVAILFLIFELSSPGLFYFISFACGACCAALIAYFDVNLLDQIALFLVMSFISFFILRAWMKRFGTRGHYHSNIYALQGKIGVVISPATEQQFGYVHIGGEVWASKTVNNEHIAAGSSVRVVDVRGAHLIVAPIEIEST